jgi:hypothetical protein
LTEKSGTVAAVGRFFGKDKWQMARFVAAKIVISVVAFAAMLGFSAAQHHAQNEPGQFD